MPVESIGNSLTSESAANAQQTGMNQEDFLKIFLAQLSFQDPLKPVDNQEFMAQMAQFTSLDQTRQLNEKIEGLLTIQAAQQSVGLIGKTVQVNTRSRLQIGEVTTVSFSSGHPEVTVKTTDGEFVTGISLSQISVVRDVEESE